MTDHYDVIIVGSGAGGGTLAHRLAPSGKRVLILERGDWLPREIENWDAEAVFVDNRYVSAGHLVRRERQGLPAAGPLLRRRRDQVLRRRAVPAAGARLRRAQAPRRHLAGLADRLRRARAVLHPGRGALPGARRPRRGPDRAAGLGAVPLPAGLPRAAHPAALRRPGRGRAAPVPLALRHHARRGRARRSAPCIRCATCDGFPCLVHAKSDADVIAVRPALRARQRRPCVRNARRTPARDRRVRPHGDRRSSPTSTARSSGSPATSSWSRPARRTRRSCCSPAPTTGTRTGWPTARTRSGATTCSTTAARSWPSRPRRTTPGSRRRSASTTTTSATPTSTTRWATCRWSASRRRRCTAGRSRSRPSLAPTFALRRRRRARRRLLAVGRGPARPGQPGHPRTATATSC